MSVKINSNHPFSSDLVIGLKAPNNAILNLDANIGKTGKAGALITDMVISSTGTLPLSGATAPYTGTFAPDAVGATYQVNFPPLLTFPGGPTSPPGYNPPTVSTFAGLWSVINGNWDLSVYDYGNGDQGGITNWSITFTYGVPSVGIWSPNAGLFTDAAGTVPYTGTAVGTVYANPATSTTYSVTVNTGTCTSAPTLVPVTVNNPIAITNVTANQKVCTDKVATFTVTATGTSPTYQWQVLTTAVGAVFTNITNGGVYSGATSSTLTITAPPVTLNGYQYRVIVNGAAPCGNQTSVARTLNVDPLPVVTISATLTSLFPGLSSHLTYTSSPAATSVQWTRNGVDIAAPAGIAQFYDVDVDHMGAYRLRVTDGNGCVGLSNTIVIGDSLSPRVFIYPNPNGGQFQVRYNPARTQTAPFGLRIFDGNGKLVYNQQYTLGVPYAPMNVNIKNLGSGIYWVEVVDVDGNRLAVGRADIVR
jgi:subtilisin-like proprotein convertase family protein